MMELFKEEIYSNEVSWRSKRKAIGEVSGELCLGTIKSP